MTEVFITFYDEMQAQVVLDTANRWLKCKDAYPTVVQVPEDGYELKRRVLADKLAKTDPYLLVDASCVPAQPKLIQTILDRFKRLGMAGLTLRGEFPDESVVPTGIRVCSRGVVKKWPQQTTETYDTEHAEAVRGAGKRVEVWPDVIYFRLGNKDKMN